MKLIHRSIIFAKKCEWMMNVSNSCRPPMHKTMRAELYRKIKSYCNSFFTDIATDSNIGNAIIFLHHTKRQKNRNNTQTRRKKQPEKETLSRHPLRGTTPRPERRGDRAVLSSFDQPAAPDVFTRPPGQLIYSAI